MSRTILIATGQPLVRAALGTVLREADFDVVAEAGDAEAAVAAVVEHRPVLCVIDIDIRGGVLLPITRMTERAPDTNVVVLAHEIDPEAVVAVVRAGACGYLPMTAKSDGLVRALEAVLQGQAAIPREAVSALAQGLRSGGRQRLAVGGRAVSLTSRQTRALELLGHGLTTQEIADELGVSPVTVRRHLGAVAAKAGLRGLSSLQQLVPGGQRDRQPSRTNALIRRPDLARPEEA